MCYLFKDKNPKYLLIHYLIIIYLIVSLKKTYVTLKILVPFHVPLQYCTYLQLFQGGLTVLLLRSCILSRLTEQQVLQTLPM